MRGGQGDDGLRDPWLGGARSGGGRSAPTAVIAHSSRRSLSNIRPETPSRAQCEGSFWQRLIDNISMDIASIVVALLIGIVQGVFEWLPISSQGNISIILTALGESPVMAVNYALFLHFGTAMAATLYFRSEIGSLFTDLLMVRTPGYDTRELRFLVLATVVSGVTGLVAYALLIEAVAALEGGLLVIVIGILLVGTGMFQYWSNGTAPPSPSKSPNFDAIIVGIGQGTAILPGISRSGTTVGLLLMRGYPGETAFRLSFLLSIPAAIGGALIGVVESGGLPGISPLAAVAALLGSAVVGYATVGALMRVARRIAFWAICLVLGTLAIIGGLLTVV